MDVLPFSSEPLALRRIKRLPLSWLPILSSPGQGRAWPSAGGVSYSVKSNENDDRVRIDLR
jgi:hypothetical protein